MNILKSQLGFKFVIVGNASVAIPDFRIDYSTLAIIPSGL
jgi:hypothetical protein